MPLGMVQIALFWAFWEAVLHGSPTSWAAAPFWPEAAPEILLPTPPASGMKLPTESASVPSTEYSVVVFLSARCPCSESHESVLKSLYAQFSSRVTFMGVHSNADETRAEALQHFERAGLPFAILEDTEGRWLEQFKAVKTPHAYLVRTQNGEILYQGGVTGSHHGPSAQEHPLFNAIQATLEGRPVKQNRARVLGCAISRRKPL